MSRKVLAAAGTMVAASLLLGGCFGLPGAAPSGSSCPALTPEHFTDRDATVADPYEIAESVGLEDVLEGTCAYGFQTDEYVGVGFHIANASLEDLEAFSDRAEPALLDGGFEDFRPTPMGIIKKNPDGAIYAISYVEHFGLDDGISQEQFDNMGLVEDEPLLYGAIEVPATD